MKTKTLFATIAITTAVALSGCEKKATTPATTPDAPKTATPTADSLKAAADTATTEVKAAVSNATTEVKKVAEEVKATAGKAASDMTATAQSYIDKARALVTDKKYQEAMTSIQQLGSMALTSDQIKMVEDLKKTIEAALTAKSGAEAAGAVQNLLKK